MKLLILALLILVVSSTFLTQAFALQLSTDRDVYSRGQPLLVYGQALPDEPLIIRLFAPDGTIAQFNQINADDAGAFSHILIRWPNATSNYSYGTYSVEAIATKEQGISKTIDVKFLANSTLVQVPQQPIVLVSVFAPQSAAINQTFRVFIQVTSDGLLVAGNPSTVLGSSHVHMPDGSVVNLSDSIKTLHQGLFYVDFTPAQEGTYIFHITATSKGTTANGSVATLVLKQNFESVSNQILQLNTVLNSTSKELDKLKFEIQGFGTVLNSSQQSITQANHNLNKSVTEMSDSVTNIDQASTQLNSLFLPVVALIAIIIALQITILARRR
ncbi:MAG TPA: methyl-accepting chemotaxis protein [Candidatus Nitrosotalea sp.]|nr:methyl-accepting chemotaxis protein [Candidatus Nitrosotalea sp.]